MVASELAPDKGPCADSTTSSWHDASAGYLTEIRDAETARNGTPGTALTYQRQLNGYVWRG
ncbi:hypothetical protein [Micromonospora sp. NPDC023644]|uniref:hypothetical protein n=1 Tax=Micromonospora sp. NPDC023644 TaxID=3154321 RepID=UPI00340013D3